ncbi:hypothetical protein J6590_000820 [Homalodisca vitripennis]|nr:hypothetical protein J6590_000820 [Homalodisca vitripennis]
MGELKLKVFAIFIVITEVHSAILDSSIDKMVNTKVNDNGDKKTEFGEFHILSNRQQRFFSSVKLNSIDSANEVDSPHAALEKADEDPNTALSGVYTDCLLNLSFPCLQRKILVFIDRLGRMAKFNLIGNFLSVVRTAKEARQSLTEDTLLARKIDDEKTLRGMIDTSIDEFFEDHVIRVTIPTIPGEGGRATSVLDFRIGENFEVEEDKNYLFRLNQFSHLVLTSALPRLERLRPLEAVHRTSCSVTDRVLLVNPSLALFLFLFFLSPAESDIPKSQMDHASEASSNL